MCASEIEHLKVLDLCVREHDHIVAQSLLGLRSRDQNVECRLIVLLLLELKRDLLKTAALIGCLGIRGADLGREDRKKHARASWTLL